MVIKVKLGNGKWSNQSLPDLDEKQFEQWRQILEERTGMQITDSRKSYLKTSLVLRMQEIGCLDYQEYFDKIVTGVNGSVEWYKLIDHLFNCTRLMGLALFTSLAIAI